MQHDQKWIDYVSDNTAWIDARYRTPDFEAPSIRSFLEQGVVTKAWRYRGRWPSVAYSLQFRDAALARLSGHIRNAQDIRRFDFARQWQDSLCPDGIRSDNHQTFEITINETPYYVMFHDSVIWMGRTLRDGRDDRPPAWVKSSS